MIWKRNRFVNWAEKPPLIKKYFDNIEVPIEYWEKKLLNEYTVDTLGETLHHVYKNNIYYRDKFNSVDFNPSDFAVVDDIARIPFTLKDELRKFPFLVLSIPREKMSQIHLSTGTTGGEPIYMIHSWEDIYIRDLAPEMPALVPIHEQDLVINALPYEMSSAGASFHRAIQCGMNAGVVPVGKGGFYSDPIKTVKAMITLKATVLFTTPFYAVYLYRTAQKENMDLSKLNINKIWLTGEGCSDAYRKRIEKLWNCRALFYYGSLECGPLGIECDNQEGYHLPSGHVYVEIVDKNTGKPLNDGEIGEIVVTTLLREGSPLIRYKTEDLGYIEDVPCKCGIKLKRIFLRGRTVDQISIGGKEYSPFYIEENLMRNEEVGYNYRLRVKNDYVHIETEILEEYSGIPNIDQKISSRIEYLCGLPNRVEIVKPLPYTGGKMVRVINEQK